MKVFGIELNKQKRELAEAETPQRLLAQRMAEADEFMKLAQTDQLSAARFLHEKQRGVTSLVLARLASKVMEPAQTKDDLTPILTRLREGGYGRLSNQDMTRIDAAIHDLANGKSATGLSDITALLDTMRSSPAKAQ